MAEAVAVREADTAPLPVQSDVLLARARAHRAAAEQAAAIQAEARRAATGDSVTQEESRSGAPAPEAAADRQDTEAAADRQDTEVAAGGPAPEGAAGGPAPEVAAGGPAPEVAAGRPDTEGAAGGLDGEVAADGADTEVAAGAPDTDVADGAAHAGSRGAPAAQPAPAATGSPADRSTAKVEADSLADGSAEDTPLRGGAAPPGEPSELTPAARAARLMAAAQGAPTPYARVRAAEQGKGRESAAAPAAASTGPADARTSPGAAAPAAAVPRAEAPVSSDVTDRADRPTAADAVAPADERPSAAQLSALGAVGLAAALGRQTRSEGDPSDPAGGAAGAGGPTVEPDAAGPTGARPADTTSRGVPVAAGGTGSTSGLEQPGPEQRDREDSGLEQPGPEQTGREHSGFQQPELEQPAAEQSAAEQAGGDQAAVEQPGPGEAGSSRTVAAAVRQALAARARAAQPSNALVDPRRGDARDRLLAVLLDDPVRAVGATVELQSQQEELSRLAEEMRTRRDELGGVVRKLADAGLGPNQVAELAGLDRAEVDRMLGQNRRP
ncbi:hypothetical protein ACL02T_21535 [Pseudonocardia sp. RS010]|uniref:hypothetical protein n=1 Tax=Pseudonocardia sp. RS010 TaxID=3385979 RepID=UPI0039A2B770